jgi:hypothetical protein
MSVTSAPSAMASMALGHFLAAVFAGNQADDLDAVAVAQHVERKARRRRDVGFANIDIVDHAVRVHHRPGQRFGEKAAGFIRRGALQEDLKPVGIDLHPGKPSDTRSALTSSIERRSMAIAVMIATTMATAPAAMNERTVTKRGERIMGMARVRARDGLAWG